MFRILHLQPGDLDDEIHCVLRTAQLGTGEKYEALSYVWGDSSDLRTVTVSDGPVSVTRSLHAALRRLRRPTTERAMWIDQLCIEQWNLDEKAEQVRSMRQIYRECTRSIVWLGDLDDAELRDAEAAMAFAGALSTFPDDHGPEIAPAFANFHRNTGAQKAFRNFATHHGNNWWARIWTVQEAVLPPTTQLLWGPLSLDWQVLQIAAENLLSHPPPEHLQDVIQELWDTLLGHFLAGVCGLSFARDGEEPLWIMHRWRFRSATDPLDKVYALMGLYQETPLPSIEKYSYEIAVEKLYANVTVDLIGYYSDLRPLLGPRDQQRLQGKLPSWALDFSVEPIYDTHGRFFNHIGRYEWFNANDDRALEYQVREDGSVLQLTGAFVDVVVEVGAALVNEHPEDIPDDTIRSRIAEWEGMATRRLERGLYPDSSDPAEAFARTLLGDLTWAEFPIERATDQHLRELLNYRQQEGKWSPPVESSLHSMVINQAFFVTRKGYTGIAGLAVQPGDEVWVFCGSRVPMLLRRREVPKGEQVAGDHAQRRELVSHTYVHGIMHGEAFQIHNEQPQLENVHIY